MANCEKIVLIGFSGAGKTSLVQTLKNSPPKDWLLFDDLDELVLKNRGQECSSIAQLIERFGWEKFRLWERQEFEGWIKQDSKGVLAMGGGAFTPLIWELYGKNPKLKFCYLKAPFELCWKRLQSAEIQRPLALLGKSQLLEIYNQRIPNFSQVPWILEIDSERSIDQIRDQFLTQFKKL